ncbi:hypothetical protein B4102_3580 [Heyndrickxia sporothermodurans]|uniref:Peptidase S74 domain-containing protein n=1 Tax=Heyndrickxia sporothermodurans TaxID=46224 RepID=A0A150KLG1_9BACI|nr:gp58-like family protein [Heyndrickxia sporothermodurans]KYC94359.1 hypothetical protein B4102_3580 [Heyndrickxia sporothermodurans]
MALMGSVDISFTKSTQIANEATKTANDASKTATDAKNTANNASKIAEEATQKAIEAVQSANGKNTNYYGPDAPSNPKKGDLWFKEVDGEYTQTYRYDGTQWVLIVDLDTSLIQKEAQKARDDAQSAVDRANQATRDAKNAIAEAQKGFDAANKANDIASVAKQMSETASGIANDAYKQAGTAITNAQSALDSAEKSLSDISKLDQSVQTQISNINGQLSSKVSQSTFNVLQGTVNTHTTQIQQTLTDITSKADKTLVDTIKKTVDSHSTLISQNATDIKARATQSSVDTLTGRVTTAEANININAKAITQNMLEVTNNYATKSSLSQTANSLTSTITQVQTNLDKLEIGGRNLIQNSYPKSKELWDFTTASTGAISSVSEGDLRITNNGSGWAQWQVYSHKGATALDNVQGDETYTLSVEIMQVSDTLNDNAWCKFRYNPSGLNTLSIDVPPDKLTKGKWIKFSVSGIVPKSLVDESTFSRVLVGYNGTGTVSFRGLKLEKGNKSTDWTPAPEDMATLVQFSSLEQTLNGFTTRVGNAEGNISSLQQTANSLSSKITDAEKNISTLTQTAQGLQTQVSDNKKNISTVTQLANALQSRMSDAEGSISTLTQTTSSLSSTINNTKDNLQSQISQLDKNINLRVQKGDVINQINLDTSGVLIQGKNLILDGNVTVTGSFKVGNANITSVDAGKMTTGTLNAARIAAGSIDASKLAVTSLSAISANIGNVTAGRISGVNIYGGSITQSSSGQNIWLDQNGFHMQANQLDIWMNNGRGLEVLYNNESKFRIDSNGHLTANDGTFIGNVGSVSDNYKMGTEMFSGGLYTVYSSSGSGSSFTGEYDSGLITLRQYPIQLPFNKSNIYESIQKGAGQQNYETQISASAINIWAFTKPGEYTSAKNFCIETGTEVTDIYSDSNITVKAIYSNLRLEGEKIYLRPSEKVYLQGALNVLDTLNIGNNINLYWNAYNNVLEFSRGIKSGNISINSYHTIKSHDGGEIYLKDGGDGYVDLTVKALHQKSKWELKENFEPMDPEVALKNIIDTDVVRYNFKGEEEIHVGLVIDDRENPEYHACSDFITPNRESKKDDTIVGELMLATKALNNYINDHKERLSIVEEQNNNLLLKVASLELELSNIKQKLGDA